MNPTLMRTHRPPCRPRRFDHWMVCQHQVEIEVWPATAEVYFRDERFADPVNKQARFDAAVYNAPNREVKWEVRALDGSPGQGQVDATGLYLAPDKDGLNSGLTEIVVATATADPMRQAFAYVTLVGRGPEPPVPTILILPQRVNLYYRQTDPVQNAQIDAVIAATNAALAAVGAPTLVNQFKTLNNWIDDSNKQQVFRALVRNSPSDLRWYVGDNPLPEADHGRLFYFRPAQDFGGDEVVSIRAELAADPTVKDEAKIVLVNYSWPAIKPISN